MSLSFIYPRSTNIGDDIQTLAATQFIDGEVNFIDRDRLSLSNETGKLILNGWWTHDPKNAWPPPKNIECLPISMHIHETAKQHFKMNAAWFKDKKVLARDLDTTKFLQSIGVDAEFGGCLTLTLPRNEPEKREGVYLVDVPRVPFEWGKRITHKTIHQFNHAVRREQAKRFLEIYQNAELVITSRLHCALPCAAMGTPVVCINSGPRYSGMEKFIVLSDGKNLEADIEKAKNFDRNNIDLYADRLRNEVSKFLSNEGTD